MGLIWAMSIRGLRLRSLLKPRQSRCLQPSIFSRFLEAPRYFENPPDTVNDVDTQSSNLNDSFRTVDWAVTRPLSWLDYLYRTIECDILIDGSEARWLEPSRTFLHDARQVCHYAESPGLQANKVANPLASEEHYKYAALQFSFSNPSNPATSAINSSHPHKRFQLPSTVLPSASFPSYLSALWLSLRGSFPATPSSLTPSVSWTTSAPTLTHRLRRNKAGAARAPGVLRHLQGRRWM